MSVRNVFFDLDGTLLPMDQDYFVRTYMKRLAAYMQPHGYDPELLVSGLRLGIRAMMKNDGSCTNETAFMDAFSEYVGKDARADTAAFESFYMTDFDNVRAVCGFTPKAAEIVHRLKDRGMRVILATNPLFPEVATRTRIRWAGLTLDEFDYCTTYENSGFCKPNPEYYREIMEKIGAEAEECAMVGNDALEDMAAETLGIKTFLLTDCLINRKEQPLDRWPRGGFDELSVWLDAL